MQHSVLPVNDNLPDEVLDAVVIGGGAAGLNGALMLARSRRAVLVIDSGTPRNAPAAAVHGLLGLDGTPPAELHARGREEVRRYGGRIITGQVTDAVAVPPTTNGDLRFVITVDGRQVATRRVLVATGLRDSLPEIPGLAAHWGRDVVHCPYCHGWEVRDRAIGVLDVGPMSLHQVWLFRQLSDDVVFFSTDVDAETRARLAARRIRVVDVPVTEVVAEGDAIAGVRLQDGTVFPREVLTVATRMEARGDGLEGLGLPMVDHPSGMGRGFASGQAGTTEVPGVWVAGNATDLSAQVGASAAAGALAGAHINADLVMAETEQAVRTAVPVSG